MNLILGVYSKFEPIIYDEVKSVIDNFSLKRNVKIETAKKLILACSNDSIYDTNLNITKKSKIISAVGGIIVNC